MARSHNGLLVEAIVEIPKGAQNKYEYDGETGFFRLERVLYSPLHYPADCGFVRGTCAEDGDPLDILILVSNPTFPGCLVPARVIGALVTEDERGMDIRLLSVAAADPRYERVEELRHLSPHSIREIEYFFGIHKELEGRKSAVTGWRDRGFAAEVLEQARKRWEEARTRGAPGVRTPAIQARRDAEREFRPGQGAPWPRAVPGSSGRRPGPGARPEPSKRRSEGANTKTMNEEPR